MSCVDFISRAIKPCQTSSTVNISKICLVSFVCESWQCSDHYHGMRDDHREQVAHTNSGSSISNANLFKLKRRKFWSCCFTFLCSHYKNNRLMFYLVLLHVAFVCLLFIFKWSVCFFLSCLRYTTIDHVKNTSTWDDAVCDQQEQVLFHIYMLTMHHYHHNLQPSIP